MDEWNDLDPSTINVLQGESIDSEIDVFQVSDVDGTADIFQGESINGSLRVVSGPYDTVDLESEVSINAWMAEDGDLHSVLQVMAPLSLDIVQIGGFEDSVRMKLGVDAETLTDAELDQEIVVKLAEEIVKLRVPGWADLTTTVDNLFLRNAVITYICYMLAPTMTSRSFIEVTTLDVKWKKDRTNWKALEERFLLEYEALLTNLVGGSSYEVNLVDFSRNTRYPIGTAVVSTS